MSLKLDINKKVTSNLPFEPQEKLGGLCIGTLLSVEVKMADVESVKKDGTPSEWEYAGHSIPRLEFRFKQAGIEEDRFFTFTESVISELKDTELQEVSEELTAKLYNNMWDRMRHILDAFKGLKQYEEIKELPELSVIGKTEVKIKEFTKLFNIVADVLNKGKNGKPLYTDLKLVMKLLPEYKERKYLTFPTFVGKGFIELAKQVDGKLSTTLKIYPNESVVLSSGKVAPGSQAVTDHSAPIDSSEMADLLNN